MVYGIQSLDSPDLVSLHTYPIGIVDHVLALVGRDGGLLTLKDEVHIGSGYPSEGNGTTFDAEHFQVVDDLLGYVGAGGSWTLFPAQGGYVLHWRTCTYCTCRAIIAVICPERPRLTPYSRGDHDGRLPACGHKGCQSLLDWEFQLGNTLRTC
jgi:hypothetical protein